MEKIKLGNKVMVSDPCYGLDTWCQGVLENVLPGTYDCKVEYSDEGDWGTRVAVIEVIHQDYEGIIRYEPEDFEVGVDSGQAGIFDYDYYCEYHMDINERPHVNDDWYDRVCDITLANKQVGTVDDLGFVSRSGFGDGGYTCYTAKNQNCEIIAIRIEFIEEDEYDEYEDEDYEEEEDYE